MLTMRRVTKATELKRFKELEGEYHYMGETHSGGDTMRLVFEEDGKWVALMVWGSACYHLKPRDAYVGWANSIRAERLKLVVNNRRFTILSEPGERRNLASECLGLVARELPRLWLKKFRYRPLLAETFCDIERTAGTRATRRRAGFRSARRATSPSMTRSATCTTRGTATGPSPSGGCSPSSSWR